MCKNKNTEQLHASLKAHEAFRRQVLALLAALLTSAALCAPAAADVPSLKGKRIGISVAGTEHYWDLKAYKGQIDEVKRLGGIPIALDGGRKDSQQSPTPSLSSLAPLPCSNPGSRKSVKRASRSLPSILPARRAST
jgi:hypothetical protein